MKSQFIGYTLLSLAMAATVTSIPAFAKDPTAPTKGAPRSPVPGTQTSGGITRFTAIDQTQDVCTSSSSYVNMPGMTVNFTKTGNTPVIVMFQGEWASKGRALLRLVINDVVQPGPGDNNSPFSAHEDSVYSTNGFNFISRLLPAGTHTARIQWAALSGSVCVDERSMVVLYR
uniref:Uncharacterized protein n=1 Tax=Cyanothece sp. (strain PCC 7425 / ATCC 29141) TaxID=395961 RepID=B8HQX2_CYAP4